MAAATSQPSEAEELIAGGARTAISHACLERRWKAVEPAGATHDWFNSAVGSRCVLSPVCVNSSLYPSCAHDCVLYPYVECECVVLCVVCVRTLGGNDGRFFATAEATFKLSPSIGEACMSILGAPQNCYATRLGTKL